MTHTSSNQLTQQVATTWHTSSEERLSRANASMAVRSSSDQTSEFSIYDQLLISLLLLVLTTSHYQRFQCLGEKVVAFNDYADNITTRTDNIAAFLTLQFVTPEANATTESLQSTTVATSSKDSTPTTSDEEAPIFVVGNTHLCYRYLEARCLQARVFLREAKELHQEIQTLYPESKVGLVLCGDFNAGPASSVYKHFEKDVSSTTILSEA